MRTSELNRIAAYVCALTMGVCAICGGQAVLAADEPGSSDPPDVNAPWDPATRFSPHWLSVSLTTRIDSQSDSPGRSEPPQELRYSRTLSITGEVDIIDSNNLIAFTQYVSDVLATDESEREIPSNPSGSSMRMYQTLRTSPARAGRAASILPYTFSASMPMDPNAGYPLLIRRLEWSAYALVAGGYEAVDVPFQATQDWVQLVPGLEILVEQATVEANKYQYRIQSRYNSRQVAYLPEGVSFIHEGEKLVDRMVIEIQILNAQGKPTGGETGGFGTSYTGSGSGQQKTYTINGNGTCSDCGTATTFRYRFAVYPYQQDVRFVLEDIPVPGF